MAFESSVTEDAAFGNPAPSYKLRWRDTTGGGIPTYLARDFGVGSAVVVEFLADWYVNQVANHSRIGFGVLRSASGVGIAAVIDDNSGGSSWRVSLGTSPSWAAYGSMTVVESGVTGLAPNAWQSIRIRCTVNEDDSTTVTVTVYDAPGGGGTAVAEVTSTFNVARADYCGAYSTFDQLGGASEAWVDNIVVQASGSTGYVPENVATSYVFTYVNDLGEQSAPSPVSSTILRPDGVSITVTTPTGLPTGISTEWGIESKRIYRAVTGATGSIFKFVAEIDLATASYVDSLADDQLGEELESEGWELPPEDLEGILALPNGIMVGFRRNQLCFSAQNRPHAWPVAFRLNTDTDIVGIGNIDTTVVVGTKSFPYLAIGSAPDAYSMTKLEVPQACVSKLSIAYLVGIGVVMASPDGYIAVSGAGQVRNLTDAVFTRKQWQALVPESIVAKAHDDVLHFWFTRSSGESPGGYMLDMKANGFGVVQLSYYAEAVHADPETDNLYLVLTEIDEPASPYLPGVSSAPTPNGRRIYQFDGDDTSRLAYLYRGKLNLMKQPTLPMIARVQATDYDSLMFRGYGDGALHFEVVVTSGEEFMLPAIGQDQFDTYEIEVLGRSSMRRAQVAEDVGEID